MALVRFKRGTAERIGMTKIEDGSILIPTDKKQLYVDIGYNTRVKLVPEKLSEIDNDDNYIKGYILDELPSSGIENILYFIPNEECYYEYIYKDNQWYQVGSDIEIDEHYDATSENPQSGKAVAEAISTKQDLIDSNHKLPYSLLSGTPIVDQNYSPSSINPQSGTAVAAAVNKLFINVLDHGVVGDGSTDDIEALQNILDNIAGENTTVYLPNRIYKTSDTLYIPHNNFQFICDGAINYSGNDSAIKSEGHGQTIKIRKMTAANGTGLEVVNELGTKTYNNVYEIGSMTSIKNYGVYVHNSLNSIYHCKFDLGEIVAADTLIKFDKSDSEGYINEHHVWVRRGASNIAAANNPVATGIYINDCGGIRVHELVLENIYSTNREGVAGVHLINANECEFRNIRWNDDENTKNNIKTKAIIFANGCNNNVFYHCYNLDNIQLSNLSGANNFIFQNPRFTGDHNALWAMINASCGITYKALHPNRVAFSPTDFPNYKIENIVGRVSIPTGVYLDDHGNKWFQNHNTIIIGDIYSHYGRSACAGQPLTLVFGAQGQTPQYIKDTSINPVTIIDNSDGKYNGKTVVIQCVDRYSSGGYQHTWTVNCISDKATAETIEIAVADWNGGLTCTKTAPSVTANSTVICDSSDASVQCTGQGYHNLTFTAITTPTSPVTIKAVVL